MPRKAFQTGDELFEAFADLVREGVIKITKHKGKDDMSSLTPPRLERLINHHDNPDPHYDYDEKWTWENYTFYRRIGCYSYIHSSGKPKKKSYWCEPVNVLLFGDVPVYNGLKEPNTGMERPSND